MKKVLNKIHSTELITNFMLVLVVLYYSNTTLAISFTTTSANDTTSPVINNLTMVDMKSNIAIITWDTDEIADSQIKFNSTGSSEIITRGSVAYTQKHNIVLTNLTAETSYQVTVNSTDNSGNTSTSSLGFSTTAISSPNNAPIISGSTTSLITWDEAYRFTPTASDSDNDTLTFDIQNAPSWASFDTSTGTLFGTPGISNVNTFSNIIISVFDGYVSSNLAAFSITVKNLESTASGESTSTLISSYPSSGSGSYSNTVNVTSSSTTATVSDGELAETTIGSITQKVKLLYTGSVEALITISDTQSNPQETKITSHYEGVTIQMQDSGVIDLKIGSHIQAQIKADGGLSYCVDHPPGSNQTCLLVRIPKSQMTINSDGSVSIVVIKQINSLENTTTVTISSSGVISTQTIQKYQGNISTFVSGQSLDAGAQIQITAGGMIITGISNQRIDF